MPGSLALRILLWTKYVARELGDDPPSHILALIWGDLPRLAVRLAKLWKVPAFAIIHDQEEYWSVSERGKKRIVTHVQRTLSSCSTVFAVSQRILDAYGVDQRKGKVLYPIPGVGRFYAASLKVCSHLERPVVAFAGSLHDWQVENLSIVAAALKRIDGYLLLITDGDNIVLKSLSTLYDNVLGHEKFRDNEEVVSFVANNASAFLISYSFRRDVQPWGYSSFPSKFLDFARAGIPIIVLCPEWSEINRWCLDKEWEFKCSTLDGSSIEALLQQIFSDIGWRAAAQRSIILALTEFDANRVHSQFVAELSG
ncbi:MAG: hypothetical protein ACK4MV_08020 [Beijerinckiaceae bacterium]